MSCLLRNARKITLNQILEIAAERNHNLLFPKDPIEFEKNYKSVQSSLELNCLSCDNLFTTTLHSYKNAKKTGCPHCKKLVSSKTHNDNGFHFQYGFGNNTEKQFVEFCQKNYNVDWLILKENLWQSSAKLNSEL